MGEQRIEWVRGKAKEGVSQSFPFVNPTKDFVIFPSLPPSLPPSVPPPLTPSPPPSPPPFPPQARWMSEQVFAELLALTQAMPGPSSTQMSFCIGILQRGVLGGLLSGMLFQYPGLVVMSLAGFGAAKVRAAVCFVCVRTCIHTYTYVCLLLNSHPLCLFLGSPNSALLYVNKPSSTPTVFPSSPRR